MGQKITHSDDVWNENLRMRVVTDGKFEQQQIEIQSRFSLICIPFNVASLFLAHSSYQIHRDRRHRRRRRWYNTAQTHTAQYTNELSQSHTHTHTDVCVYVCKSH